MIVWSSRVAMMWSSAYAEGEREIYLGLPINQQDFNIKLN